MLLETILICIFRCVWYFFLFFCIKECGIRRGVRRVIRDRDTAGYRSVSYIVYLYFYVLYGCARRLLFCVLEAS